MRFDNAFIPIGACWSSPFVRWQGALADVSSLDVAMHVTRDALAARQLDPQSFTQLVMGLTIPQNDAFYAVPWTASRLGMEAVTGPLIAQACATSVACLAAAAAAVQGDSNEQVLVVAADRTSNGPVLIYPSPSGMGGAPQIENWVLDNFAADPNTGSAMVTTAENVARQGGLSREALDDLTMLRYQQYASSLRDDRAVQKRYLQPVNLPARKGQVHSVDTDQGIHPYDRENLRSLKPTTAGGVVTFGSQTHPADGAAGAVVCSAERARALSKGEGSVRLLGVAQARVEKACMPKAATLAAEKVLAECGRNMAEVRLVATHNPFAVNDAWFCRQTGFDAEKMNVYGCSLIYGHPQGPTGLRTIAELIVALHAQGGGLGLFTGCAAGDTGAALLLSVQ